MKKRNILLILPLLFLTVSCGENSTDKNSIKYNIINKILDNVNVKITGEETITYPSEYKYMDSSTKISINRDYKSINEENGTKTAAIRDYSNGEFTTYLQGDDGQIVNEFLSSKNEVVSVDYTPSNIQLLFSEYFANPFTYIDESDIDDDYSLNLAKASLLVEAYTGYQYAVKEAKFNVEDNVATSLNIEFFDKINGLVSTDETISITNSLSLDIKFNYDIAEIKHLTPRNISDEGLNNVFKNDENFTITFESDATSDTCIVYATSDAIYVHTGIKDIGIVDGDIYYKKASNGSYDQYIYDASELKFNLESFDVKLDDILPNVESVSPNILLNESENVFTFDNFSAKYGIENLILPNYKISSGLGLNGTLTLKNGKISKLYAKFNETSPFSITQNYYNYGSTSMPSWLDISTIK